MYCVIVDPPPGLAHKEFNATRCVSSHRLWGDHGQEALEAARVCLINASATGTEILKNLVLPGKMG